MQELKAHKIRKKIEELNAQLEGHQEKCKHKKVQKIAKSNTGHYDKSNDSYWYECRCPTCLKSWIESQ
jgi:hypothetical protein